MYVILKLFCNKNLLFGYYRRKLWSVLLTRDLTGVNSSKTSQVCHIIVYDSNYLRKKMRTNPFFFQNIMQNMMIIP